MTHGTAVSRGMYDMRRRGSLNKGYPASLELRKLYTALPDRDAEKHLVRRIVDESGEDYLYPRNYFVELPLPPAARRALSSIAK